MEKDVSKQKAALSTQIAKIPRLRGTGPNPFEYDRWDARTRESVSYTHLTLPTILLV